MLTSDRVRFQSQAVGLTACWEINGEFYVKGISDRSIPLLLGKWHSYALRRFQEFSVSPPRTPAPVGHRIMDLASCSDAAIHEWLWRHVPERTVKLCHQTIEDLMDIKKVCDPSSYRKDTHRSEETWSRLRSMALQSAISNQQNVHITHNIFEKLRRSSGTTKIKQESIAQIPYVVQVNEWSDIDKFDIRETDVQSLFWECVSIHSKTSE